MTPPRREAALRALHRATLLLYPRRFRQRFAADLDRCLAEQLAARRASGSGAVWRAGLRATALALVGCVSAWRHERSPAPRPDAPPPRPRETPMLPFLHDLRLAARRLRRSPTFLVLGAASLAVGVGANASVLSIVDGLIWSRLPVPEASRLVRVAELNEHGLRNVAYGNYQSLAEETGEAFDGVSVQRLESFAIETGDRLELAFGELVSADYFETLRLRPAVGRLFTRADAEAPSAPLVVVLSHHLWTRSFSADPAIVGRSVRINDVPATVLGVTPASFQGTKFALGMDLFVPVRPWGRAQGWGDWERDRVGASWGVIARLGDGVDTDRAQAAADVLAARLADQHPRSNATTRFRLFDERVARITPHAEGTLGLISAIAVGASILVLLVACANVAGLLLTRAEDRRGEIGLRAALGARRGRVIREMLLESVLVAGAGATLGVALAFAAPRLLLGLLPPLPYRFALGLAPSPRVVVVALSIALCAVTASALIPALRATRRAPRRGAPLGALRGARRGRGLDLVVVGMTAVAFLSLTLGALFSQALSAVRQVDPGFEIEDRLVASFDLSLAGDPELSPRQYADRLLDRVGGLAGVGGAAIGSLMPLGDAAENSSVFAHERAVDEQDAGERAWLASITPGWLDTAGTALLEGRGFVAADDADSPAVALVNRQLAERLWPGRSALGRTLRFGRDPGGPTAEVVGVVEDGRYEQITEPRRAALFLPWSQAPSSAAVLLVRAEGVAAVELTPSLREVARRVDPRVPLFAARTVEAHLIGSLWLFRAAAGLAAAFGAMALVLTLAGVYGVISHRVARSTRELGIRIAVGARTRQLLLQVLRGGLLLSVVGSGLGALLALGAGSGVAGLLVGVDPRDPALFSLVGGLLIAVSVLAALRPALRAARVDAVRSLRAD